MDNSLAVEANKLNGRLLSIIKPLLAGETNRHIAMESGITEANVSRIFNGKQRITIDTLMSLSKVAGIDPWEVWEKAEEAGK